MFAAMSADKPGPERAADGRIVEGELGEVFGELRSTLDADEAGDERYFKDDAQQQQLAALWPVSRKVLATAAGVVALVAVPYAHPVLGEVCVPGSPDKCFSLRLLTSRKSTAMGQVAAAPIPDDVIEEWDMRGSTDDQQSRANELDAPVADARGPIAAGGRKGPAMKIPDPVKEGKAPRDAAIEDPSGKALDKFFAKLMRVDNGEEGAVARIVYYGDSIVASDFVTGKLRRLLQTRFGDAGHGYAIIANAWPGFFHIDVARTSTSDWRFSTCRGPYAEDGFYGLGCASFASYNPGNWSRFATADLDKWGRKVSRFELEYLKHPGGGTLEIHVDGDKREDLDTSSDEAQVAWHTVEVDDGAHSFKIRTVDKKPIRVFGVSMERDVPGVTLTALGITGCRARFLDKQDDAHWATVLQHAKPDLVVLAFGSNEITDGSMYPMDKLRETNAAVMEQIEKALPDASLMLALPPDMAGSSPEQASRPMVPIVVENLKRVAHERGWAAWDQYFVMNGAGSMRAWMASNLGNADGFHPTGRGANLLGSWQYLALMDAYEQYKARKR